MIFNIFFYAFMQNISNLIYDINNIKISIKKKWKEKLRIICKNIITNSLRHPSQQ